MSKLKVECDALPLSQIPPATTATGMARSPSHESFATDLSLMSLSSLGSEMGRLRSFLRLSRNGEEMAEDVLRRSPNMLDGARGGWVVGNTRSGRGSRCSLLQVPSEHYGGTNNSTTTGRRPITDEILFEEETEIIRNCGALSSVLGLMKSFSTSDIDQVMILERENLRSAVSEVALSSWRRYDMPHERLEYTSRSCSTWVAVGDMSSTSQLPSPQTVTGQSGQSPEITAIDFVRSVNKKVRQMYIRRRLESTYRALERLTRNELSAESDSKPQTPTNATPPVNITVPQVQISTDLDRSIRSELQISSLGFRGANKTLSLTVKDIERDKGKPLSKYERNMMIFNWLQSLDENGFDQLT